MSEDQGRETRVVTVNGRAIVIRKLTDVQMGLLLRLTKILKAESVGAEGKVEAVDRMFAILDSVVKQPADKEFVEDLQIKGELELKDMLSWVTVFQEEKPKVPQVRRGRTASRS